MPVDVPIALLGYGNVGGAVARLLAESADDIERATGHRLRIVRALVRDPGRERKHLPDDGVLTTDFDVDPRRPVDRARRRADGRHRADGRLRPRAPARRQAGRLGEQAARRAPRRGALRRGVGERRAASVRGLRLRGDPRDQGAARVARRDERPSRPRHRQRHDELHPLADGAGRRLSRRARGGAAARLRGAGSDRGRERRRRGGEDGDPRHGRVRLAHDARRRRVRRHRGHHAGSRARRARARDDRAARRLRDARRREARRARAAVARRPAPSARGRRRAVQRGDAAGRRDSRDHARRARAPAGSRRRPRSSPT